MVSANSNMARAADIIVNQIRMGNEHVPKVCQIVQQGYDVNHPVLHSGITLLMHAATRLNGSGMDEILKLNPDLERKDEMGRTALHFAARSANIEALKSLLAKYDASELEDIDVQTTGGVTPLMMGV